MKTVKKIIAILLLVILIPKAAQADTYKSFDIVGISNDEYKPNYFIKCGFIPSYNPGELIAYRGYTLDNYVVFWQPSTYQDGPLTGYFRWENPNYIIVDGEQTVNLLFEAMTGETVILKIYLYGVPNELVERETQLSNEMKNDVVDEISTTLTANNLLLETDTAYDINLNDKVAGSTYFWTSSNSSVVEVNSKSGKLKAIKEGKANVTCDITLPEGKTQTLISEVVVGTDENFPLLTEAILDLEVGNYFDINLENKIAKSKYRWVSSDRSIAKVNSSSGFVTAISEGTAKVTCTITTPDNQVIVLKCDVNITAAKTVTE